MSLLAQILCSPVYFVESRATAVSGGTLNELRAPVAIYMDFAFACIGSGNSPTYGRVTYPIATGDFAQLQYLFVSISGGDAIF